MPAYNTQFELNVEDMDHIETALLARKKDLSLQRITLLAAEDSDDTASQKMDDIDAGLAEIHDLLGRLHNQKVFFRPTQGQETPYISG